MTSPLKFYRLDAKHRVVPCRDVMEWAACFENNRIVARTQFACGVTVSTVFLGLDHRWSFDGPPLVFETMVFEMDASGDGEQWRYSSWDDALTGHKATVRRVKKLIEKAGLSTKLAKA